VRERNVVPDSPDPHDERTRVLALVRRFGWNATSFQALEPGYRYLFVDGAACVAFVDTGRAWVAAGAPLADEADFETVTAAFLREARAANRRACFFATEDRFTKQVPLRSLLVGEQPVWEPAGWDAALRASASLREQVRRARAKGVRVRLAGTQAAPDGTELRDAVVGFVERWLGARELAPLGFLAQVDPLAFLPDCPLFVAEWAGKLVGILSVAPIHGREGWLLQNLLRAPDAPNGTAELLFDQAMREANARGLTFVTLGLAPLAGRVAAPLRLARQAGRGLFNFEGLRAFKAKLQPSRWDPIYVSFPRETSAPRAIVDVLAAFARGKFVRFGIATLARGPTPLVSLLAFLLVPWTVLLACCRWRTWFPHPALKWGWVAFDVLVAAGLFALRRRWRPTLARLLVAAIGADAIATGLEALWWNLPRAPRAEVRALLVVAWLAPVFATLVLSAAVRRRRA
jgi:phosphatidylglycerol lysyltransferase